MISTCRTCNKEFTYYPSNSKGWYCSLKCTSSNPSYLERQRITHTGKKMSDSHRLKASLRFKGKKQSQEHIANRVASLVANYDKVGRKLDDYTRIRLSKEYKEWRRAVFERDNYTCVQCGDKRGGNLEADHIISLSFLVEEAKVTGTENYYDVDNGQTLCTSCHKKTHSYAKHVKHHIEYGILDTSRILYEQGGSKGNFSTYYTTVTERLIEQLKERLE